MPVELVTDTFESRKGETFTAAAEERTLTLTLRSADALYAPPGDQGRTPFSLVFLEASQDRMEQQTVTMTHEEMGEFPLFVVPIAAGEAGLRYEAVFT